MRKHHKVTVACPATKCIYNDTNGFCAARTQIDMRMIGSGSLAKLECMDYVHKDELSEMFVEVNRTTGV